MLEYAIVLPAATGKSTLLRSLRIPTVQEADEICHPRGTVELDNLRSSSKITGDWTEYDKLLSSEIHARADPSTRIILLATSDLAKALGVDIIGTIVLNEELWTHNVNARNENVSKYLDHYNQAVREGAWICMSYEDLLHQVLRVIATIR